MVGEVSEILFHLINTSDCSLFVRYSSFMRYNVDIEDYD